VPGNRLSRYYETVLLHPQIGSTALRLYKDGYRDSIDAIDEHGCVDVPEGPGLGVEYDWDFILAHRTDGTGYK
jgi:L-alanine-DL-glutamate epimerase-like enolase superfamily enzyme